MAKKDYYSVLGVERNASVSDIKKAYKRLVKENHPDLASDKAEAEHRMGAINEAYGVLSDEEKRAYYDQFGEGPSSAGGGYANMDNMGGFGGFGGFSDVFDLFSGAMGGGFSGGGGRNRASRGDDVKVTVKLSLEEAYTGVRRMVTYKVRELCLNCQGKLTVEPDGVEVCATCGGMGQVRRQLNIGFGSISQVVPCQDCGGVGKKVKKPCPECGGHGLVRNERKLEVTIPAGIEDRMVVRVSGQGEAGENGGPAGNLLVVVQVEEDVRFSREGPNLAINKRIAFTDAALGCEVEIDLLGGAKEKLKIPAGTQSGTPFRLKGKGMPDVHSGRKGDAHVIVDVMVPTKLNAQQKKLLKEFAGAGSQEADPRRSDLFSRIKDAIFG